MRRWLTLILSVMFVSCGKQANKPPFYGNETESIGDSIPLNNDVVSIPFREEHGVKYIKVKVNGVEMEMILDSGCSLTLISITEANFLYKQGVLKKEHILGTSMSVIADGSIVENTSVVIEKVEISDNIVFYNVDATVSPNANAPLLLGNSVLGEVASYEVDNQNQVINFKKK